MNGAWKRTHLEGSWQNGVPMPHGPIGLSLVFMHLAQLGYGIYSQVRDSLRACLPALSALDPSLCTREQDVLLLASRPQLLLLGMALRLLSTVATTYECMQNDRRRRNNSNECLPACLPRVRALLRRSTKTGTCAAASSRCCACRRRRRRRETTADNEAWCACVCVRVPCFQRMWRACCIVFWYAHCCDVYCRAVVAGLRRRRHSGGGRMGGVVLTRALLHSQSGASQPLQHSFTCPRAAAKPHSDRNPPPAKRRRQQRSSVSKPQRARRALIEAARSAMLAARGPMAAQQRRLGGHRSAVLLTAAPRRCVRPALRLRVDAAASSGGSWQASAAAALQQQPAFQLAAAVVGACQRLISSARERFAAAFPQLQNVDKQVCRTCGGLAGMCSTCRSAADGLRAPSKRCCGVRAAAHNNRRADTCLLAHHAALRHTPGAAAAAGHAVRAHAHDGGAGAAARARLTGVAQCRVRAHV